jgi:hypothetical protein
MIDDALKRVGYEARSWGVDVRDLSIMEQQ